MGGAKPGTGRGVGHRGHAGTIPDRERKRAPLAWRVGGAHLLAGDQLVLGDDRPAVRAQALSVVGAVHDGIRQAAVDALAAEHVPALRDDTNGPRRHVEADGTLGVQLPSSQPLHHHRGQGDIRPGAGAASSKDLRQVFLGVLRERGVREDAVLLRVQLPDVPGEQGRVAGQAQLREESQGAGEVVEDGPGAHVAVEGRLAALLQAEVPVGVQLVERLINARLLELQGEDLLPVHLVRLHAPEHHRL